MSPVEDYPGLPTAAEWERLRKSRDAIQQSACTNCGATPGERCRTPKGSSVEVPHATRREAAMAAGHWSPGGAR